MGDYGHYDWYDEVDVRRRLRLGPQKVRRVDGPEPMDDRTRLLTRYYIRPGQEFPSGIAQPMKCHGLTTVEAPEASADSTPIRAGSPSDRGTRTTFFPHRRLGAEARRYRPEEESEAAQAFYRGRSLPKRLRRRGDDRPRPNCETLNTSRVTYRRNRPRWTWISRGYRSSASTSSVENECDRSRISTKIQGQINVSGRTRPKEGRGRHTGKI